MQCDQCVDGTLDYRSAPNRFKHFLRDNKFVFVRIPEEMSLLTCDECSNYVLTNEEELLVREVCKDTPEIDPKEISCYFLSEFDLLEEANFLIKKSLKQDFSLKEAYALLKNGVFHGTIFESKMSDIKFLLDNDDLTKPNDSDYESALMKFETPCIELGEE